MTTRRHCDPAPTPGASAPAPETAREADDEDPGDRRQGSRQCRTRDRGQAPRGPPRPGGSPVPRSPPHRGCAGNRQDGPRQGHRAKPRRLLPADPVHPGPAALGRVRAVDLQPEDPGVRVPARADLQPGRPRRRDQPGDAQDAVRPARVHGGAAGDDRRDDLHDAGPVPRHRHPEPDRVRGHVRAAGGPARPVHAPPAPGLPAADRGDRHPRRAEADAPARGHRGGPVDRGAARDAGRGPRDLRRLDGLRLHRPAGQRHPQPPRRVPRRLAARLDRAVPGRPGARRAARARLRHPGRHQGAGRAGAGAPPDHQDQLLDPRRPGRPGGPRAARIDRRSTASARPAAARPSCAPATAVRRPRRAPDRIDQATEAEGADR